MVDYLTVPLIWVGRPITLPESGRVLPSGAYGAFTAYSRSRSALLVDTIRPPFPH